MYTIHIYICRESYQKQLCYQNITRSLVSHFNYIISEIINSWCNVHKLINHNTNPEIVESNAKKWFKKKAYETVLLVDWNQIILYYNAIYLIRYITQIMN